MFYREIEKNLNEWKARENRKPLVLRGARQTGKTTVVEKFSESFGNFISLNLEKTKDRSYFEKGLAVKDVVSLISLETHQDVNENTLLFLDEIQNCPEAVSLLRYFYEDMKWLHVIAAGSLLKVMMEKKEVSFPVGRVEYLYLYPMSFEEYLMAAGENQALKLLNEIPFKEYGHSSLKRLFREYALVGGMPEAVSEYLRNEKMIQNVSVVYESLMTGFYDDVAKYAETKREADIIRFLIETSPYKISERITFEKFGNSNYKSKDVGDAFRTLERAMLVYLNYPTTETEVPLLVNKKRKPRLQFLDSGLVNYELGIQSEFIKFEDLNSIYSGRVCEQIVGQQLLAQDNTTNNNPIFWVRENNQSNAEVDFVKVIDGDVVPVEIKPGKDGRLRSLHSFLDKSESNCAIRIYSDEFKVEKVSTVAGKEYTLINLPFYLSGKIDEYYLRYKDM